jgi:hypothetical protein
MVGIIQAYADKLSRTSNAGADAAVGRDDWQRGRINPRDSLQAFRADGCAADIGNMAQ